MLVRKRPLNPRERARKEDDVVAVRPAEGAVTVHEPRTKVDLTRYTEQHAFAFDQVLDEGASTANANPPAKDWWRDMYGHGTHVAGACGRLT